MKSYLGSSYGMQGEGRW